MTAPPFSPPANPPGAWRLAAAGIAVVAFAAGPGAGRAVDRVAAVVAVVGGLAITLVAGPLYGLTTRAAEDLVDRSGYVTAVLGDGGGGTR